MTDHLKPSKSKSPQKHPNEQEKRLARILGGTCNAGSGNGNRKNDVRTELFDVECKTTTAKSFSLKREELRLAENQATVEHRGLLFAIDFADEEKRRTDRYFVVPEYVLFELLDGS